MALPSALFWSAVAVFFVLRIRIGGLSIRDALLELVGWGKPAYGRWHIVFAVVMLGGTLGLWAWLAAGCRASLT